MGGSIRGAAHSGGRRPLWGAPGHSPHTPGAVRVPAWLQEPDGTLGWGELERRAMVGAGAGAAEPWEAGGLPRPDQTGIPGALSGRSGGVSQRRGQEAEAQAAACCVRFLGRP